MVNYARPTSLDQALAILKDQDRAILAGGTDIYPARTTRAGWGHTHHRDVLDISALRELRGIEESDAGWRIGALTTWTDIIRADLPPLFDGLKAAGRQVGGIQIQNRGTLCGNVCNASPAADGVPCLLALDAEIELASHRGRRTLPLGAFIEANRKTAIKPDEIAVALHIPRRDGVGRFLKLGARRYLVISITMVAGCLEIADDGTIQSARISVGACSAVAQRLPALEADLAGKPVSAASQVVDAHHFTSLTPIDDIRASGTFRAHAAVALTRDLLASFTVPSERAA